MKKILKNTKMAKVFSLAFIFACLFMFGFNAGAQSENDMPESGIEDIKVSEQSEVSIIQYDVSSFQTVSDIDYDTYLELHAGAGFNQSEIILLGTDATDIKSIEPMEDYGEGTLFVDEEGYASWQFNVQQAGLYRFEFDYYTAQGTGSPIERAIYIDGKLPFSEAYNINFSRVFRDDGDIQTSTSGDDYRPDQIEVHTWRTQSAIDQFGYFGENLYFYLDQGIHTITLVSLREPMVIGQIKLISKEVTYLSYNDYIENARAAGATEVQGQMTSGVYEDGIFIVQAEKTYEKSHSSLFPINDNTSPNTTPYDTRHKKLNAIGGTRWTASGQWISWEIEVPEDGLYHIGARSKQNVYRDMMSYRTIYIDGQVPFYEALNLEYAFTDSWQVAPFGGEGRAYLFYLTKGRHVITLSVSLGGVKDILMESSQILNELNSISLQLIALMGTSPDEDRDYRIDVFMPELLVWINEEKERLEAVRADLLGLEGDGDEMIAQINKLVFIMEEMVGKPDRIAELFGLYREYIRSYGNWIMQAREQPLLLDYMFVSESNVRLPNAELGFFQGLYSGLESFIASFFIDYTSLSGKVENVDESDIITIWIGNGLSGGRDQAMALSKMIVEDFTRKTGIYVNLQLVPGGTILTATLAGNGPDVALQLGSGSPVDYAMRNAVYDLSTFSDFEEIMERFPESAVTPFEYNGGVYALPETFSFPMLFYRKDIMRDLGIDVSKIQTWSDVITMLPTLQRQNMTFGLPADTSIYSLFLYQRNGSFYNSDLSASALDSKVAIDAFTFWIDFYVNYGLEKDYNFVDRFRTGEMPIGIADYTIYNLLSVSAPEIRGQWAMVPVPGTMQSDGSINYVAPSDGLGAIIMNSAENPDAAWEFLKWWTSADVQYKYGMELEAVMGVGARYNTANIQAFNQMPWAAADRRNLLHQMALTRGTPQVPGGYYTSRYLDFARIAAYDQDEKDLRLKRNTKDILLDYVDEINGEIKQKRREFGLE